MNATDRFAAWYYVTPGDSFRSINLDRTAIVRAKRPDANLPGGNLPGIPGGLGGGASPFPNTLPPIQP